MAGQKRVEDARRRAYVPAIHVFFLGRKDVDARDKRGHDEEKMNSLTRGGEAG
jgi:hypothetical protein